MVTVCTIVLSYNRPRMLREALRSIHGADQVILLDDGSDFDVWALGREELERFPWKEIRVAPRMTVEERLRTPRLGKAINMAIKSTFCRVVTYLCDDDLFGPQWIHAVRQFFTTYPSEHLLVGRWGVFQDGAAPGGAPCKLDVPLTTGNFAHARDCSFVCGNWWDETTIGSHDGVFVPKILRRHPIKGMFAADVQAGWRREHAYNMLKYTRGTGYAPDAGQVLSRKTLE